MAPFIVFPAIDLRHGEVVRLREGDPSRQTTYSSHPGEVAAAWLQAGARWLHVVNLDGAFGEADSSNRNALRDILLEAKLAGAQVQLGGGMRSELAIEAAFSLGVNRVILGTLAIQKPEILPSLIAQYGAERIAASLDARDGLVQIRGWQSATPYLAVELALQFHQAGLLWLVFTDIARDGAQTGLNLPATITLSQASHLKIIASGGVGSWADVRSACKADLAGIIVGKALYEESFDPFELFHYSEANPMNSGQDSVAK